MELLERVVELSLEGYCCSQVMALLLLELLGEEDDGFVRAMGGLINGGGYSGGDCGCMSGGACLISYITGKGEENDADLPGHVSALCHFTHWFAEEMKERYGGTDCGEILGGDQRRKMERCPEIMALSFEKCIEILSGKGLI